MKKRPTDAELEVLQILWKNGPSTVRYVNTELSKNREVVYTTTLKMMQVMTTEKNFLKRDTSQRQHIYEAIITEDEIQESVLDKMLDTAFQGSPLRLVVRALGHEKTSQKDLDEIKKIIQKLEKDNQ